MGSIANNSRNIFNTLAKNSFTFSDEGAHLIGSHKLNTIDVLNTKNVREAVRIISKDIVDQIE